MLAEGTGPEECEVCGCSHPVLTERDRIIRQLGDNKFDILDGNRAIVRAGIKGQKAATNAARSGAANGGRVFWLNDDGSVE